MIEKLQSKINKKELNKIEKLAQEIPQIQTALELLEKYEISKEAIQLIKLLLEMKKLEISTNKEEVLVGKMAANLVDAREVLNFLEQFLAKLIINVRTICSNIIIKTCQMCNKEELTNNLIEVLTKEMQLLEEIKKEELNKKIEAIIKESLK